MSETKQTINIEMTRRNVLAGGVTVLAGLTLGRFANATAADVEAKVAEVAGGKTIQSGRIALDMPQIAENGNTVPMSISVESPMTDADYVKSLHVYSEGNPAPDVASFHFTPMSGKAEISTRMRMLKTQNIVAVAEMSDGSVFMESVQVKVTIGGCGG